MRMETLKKVDKTAEIRLSIDELSALKNVLDEVYNAIYISEFKTRMGVSREEVMALSNAILQAIEELRLSDSTENS